MRNLRTSLRRTKQAVKSGLATSHVPKLWATLNSGLRVLKEATDNTLEKNHTIMYRLLTLSVGLLFITIYSCGEKKNKDNTIAETEASDGNITITKEQFDNSRMVLGKLEEKVFPITISTNGMIDVPPENRAVVTAMMGGYIKNTPLLIGDSVKKGQQLVTIENPEFVRLQQDYMEIKQQLVYLKSEYDRQKTLREENITSQKSFLKAESEFKTANAQYNGLKKQLTMLNISPTQVEQGNISAIATIFAPINGSITKMNVTKGTYVSPATAILEIIDNDHIHLELSVFEKDIMKIKKGQPIRFRIPEASEETFGAEVYLIGTAITENRTIKVHGHLHEERKNNFLTGMFVNAEIVTKNTSSKAIDASAVVEQEGKYFVLRTKAALNTEYTFEKVEVQIGNTSDGFTQITNTTAFSDADTFLTKGAFDLLGE